MPTPICTPIDPPLANNPGILLCVTVGLCARGTPPTPVPRAGGSESGAGSTTTSDPVNESKRRTKSKPTYSGNPRVAIPPSVGRHTAVGPHWHRQSRADPREVDFETGGRASRNETQPVR